jgi:hypothetical protein
LLHESSVGEELGPLGDSVFSEGEDVVLGAIDAT